MRVIEATDDQKNDWNRISNTMPGSLPLNRFEWKNILRDSYGIKPLFVYLSDGVGQMKGIAATYITDDIYMRKNIFSTRYGLIAVDDDCIGEIIHFLKDYCLGYMGSNLRQVNFTLISRVSLHKERLCSYRLVKTWMVHGIV